MPYCPKCGKETSEESRFCPTCGHTLSAPTAPPAPVAPKVPVRSTWRPTGITVLAILQVLGSIVFLGFGALLILIAGFLGLSGFLSEVPMVPRFIGGLAAAVLGIIMILIGLIGFAVTYGYWNGFSWAWTLGLVITILALFISLVSTNWVGIIIEGLIIYYLTRPHVKRFFGKEPIQVTV